MATQVLPSPTSSPGLERRRTPRQVVILAIFLLAFLVLYAAMAMVAMPLHAPLATFNTFMALWGVCFCLYAAVSAWVLGSKPLQGVWGKAELALIFCGAILFRLLLIRTPPGLSGDAWRYLWDARVTLHGYSPYLYAPADRLLLPLRDIVYAHSSYRLTPTKYPPGAQLFFLLAYALNPTSLIGLKSVLVVLDLVTCGALALLLARRGLDARRVVIYAWGPLPIVEFALQGHSDAIAVTFMALAVLYATSSRQGLRILAGVFIGLATAARLYPILLLVVLLRRRDWGLLAAWAGTIVLVYLPFMLLSWSDVRAVLFSFSGQQDSHPSVTVMFPVYLAGVIRARVSFPATVSVNHVLQVVVGVALVGWVGIQRLRERIREEMAILLLIAVFLLGFAHVFPWYATGLLPWMAVVAEPIWTRERGISSRGLAVASVWYFTCTVVLSYIPGLPQFFNGPNWLIYYSASFGVMTAGLVTAAAVAWNQYRRSNC